jgi:D-glycero-D-manno-heptose 1,7-bisphosphate phosphatase
MSFEVDVKLRTFTKTPAYVSAVAPGLHIPFNSRLLGRTSLETQAAVFLDRDGVLVRDVHYLKKPSQVELLPGIASLTSLQHRFHLIVATNQSGIGRNLFTESDLLLIHSELVHQLSRHDILIDAFYYCPHLPSAANEAYRVACECRKPKPGLLCRAAADWDVDLKGSYMIGDSLRDMAAGCAAGLAESILLSDSEVPDSCPKHQQAQDLAAAVKIILGGTA